MFVCVWRFTSINCNKVALVGIPASHWNCRIFENILPRQSHNFHWQPPLLNFFFIHFYSSHLKFCNFLSFYLTACVIQHHYLGGKQEWRRAKYFSFSSILVFFSLAQQKVCAKNLLSFISNLHKILRLRWKYVYLLVVLGLYKVISELFFLFFILKI